jgi:hypothetical protein
MTNPWAEQLRDAILSNSALREGIQDDEAQPLIDWALQLAEEVTAGLPSMPDSVTEQRFEALSEALPKLITRITWAVVYRQKKGPDWTTRTLTQLNELNMTLRGANAPQISEARMAELANLQDELEPGALILNLIETLSPPEPPENGEYIL